MAALNEQIVWVVGGGSGMGRAAALELAAGGATVIISGRRAEALQEVAAAPGANGRISIAPLDVSDTAAVARTAADLLKRHGRVDTLVMAAGAIAGHRPWAEISPADWAQVGAINSGGLFNCVHALLPSMRQRRSGLFINIGSWGGRFALKFTGPAYAASKRAMIAMNETINLEEGDNGIRACIILPAGVNTDFLNDRPVPLPKEVLDPLLKPEDIGRLIRFVASQPQHVCMNEILISPTSNYVYQHSA